MTNDETILPPEIHWREALARGSFLLQRDPESGECVFPPRLDFDSQNKLEWFEATGRGKVYSVTVIAQRPPAEPYNVVLVDLEEGPRLMATVEGVVAEEVHIGMLVAARISEGEDGPKLVFHPA